MTVRELIERLNAEDPEVPAGSLLTVVITEGDQNDIWTRTVANPCVFATKDAVVIRV